MVEFGLKLTDNKVEEWAHAYINYEALKGLIAAAKKAERARDELEARNASLAAEIKVQVATSNSSNYLNVDSDSKFDDLSYADESETQSLISFSEPNSAHGGGGGAVAGVITSGHYGGYGTSSHHEAQNGSNPDFLRTGEKTGLSRTSSDASLSSATSMVESVSRSVSGYLPYFQRHTYEHKMKKAIKNENKAIQNFRSSLYDEVSM